MNAAATSAVAGAADYPTQLSIEYPSSTPRWQPLVASLILLPHWVALLFLGIGAGFVNFIAVLSVLFTGKYPEGMRNYMVGVMRWSSRVMAYATWTTSKYPPFTMDETPEDTVHLSIEAPVGNYGRMRAFQAYLLYPYMLVVGIFGAVAYLMMFIAFFAILFTGRYPEGMFNMVVNFQRMAMRGAGYQYLLVKQYPPFGG